MSGIFGAFNTTLKPLDRSVIQRATQSIRHRGPDDEGYLLYNTLQKRIFACGGADTDPRLTLPSIYERSSELFNLVLGFRRLSIMDLSAAGHQPMSTSDGSMWITLNGEIYNHVELREELKGLGYTFRSGSDAEVLLAAYGAWGAGVLSRLVGMFAFVILDVEQNRLFLARDFFGIKPLYYYYSDVGLAFSSEIKALLELPYLQRRADPAGVLSYLKDGLTDQDDGTLFEGVRQLSPAHYLEIDLSDPRPPQPQRYWQIDLSRRVNLPFTEAAQQLKDLFLENLRMHLRSDAPVGVALSGGIDSSAIVVGMRQVQGDGSPIHTFSFIENDSQTNEEHWVDLVAGYTHAVAHKTAPRPDELMEGLDNLIYAQDEPFINTSIYAQSCVFRLARQNEIKVMLDGHGADELLAGYYPLISARMASLWRQNNYKAARYLASNAARLPGVNPTLLFENMLDLVVPRYLRTMSRQMLGVHSIPSWMNASWFNEHEVSPRAIFRSRSKEVLREMLYQSVVRAGLPMLLRYEDRNSMAYSIESRLPFLTPSLVQFVFSLPEEYLITPLAVTKAVFRQSMVDVVPQAILERKDQIGLISAGQVWQASLRGWVDCMLQGGGAERMPALNLRAVRSEWAAVQAGRRPFDYRIWRWVNLIRWMERFGVEFK